MTVWSIIIILTVASAGSEVMAQEKVYSSFCTTLEMLESTPVMTYRIASNYGQSHINAGFRLVVWV